MITQLTRTANFFSSGATRAYEFRKRQLEALRKALYTYEEKIYSALYADLKKNKEECWVTEIGFTIGEINFALKHLEGWMKNKKVPTNLLNFPGKSFLISEPLGVVLIIGPWNYPLQLVLAPLVGAIAAGNAVILKPSEHAPHTSAVLLTIINDTFPKEYISVVEGEGSIVIPQMMNHFRFDHVFYTGSTAVGKMIYEMAAKKLVPVTLELGGKSPCIVDETADLKVAAKRIALTKFSNAGQMCVAPDYLLVHRSIQEEFIQLLIQQIKAFYESDEYHFGKLINAKSFERLQPYLNEGTILYGGNYDAERLFIQPTIIALNDAKAAIMNEEVFGPILPILTWQSEEEAYAIIEQNKNPLALYIFTNDTKKEKEWITGIPFGGGCINNASWHLTNHHLPFGGRGNSGIGRYHGRYSFQTFSHQKGILKTPTWFDPAVKYPPFKGKLKWFKKLIK